MNWQLSPYTLPLVITGGITLVSAGVTYRQRTVAGSRNLLALLFSIVIWVFAYVAELSAVDLEAKIFWAKVEYIGIVYLPIGYTLFALKYIGDFQKIKKPRLFTAVLFIIPFITLTLTWTNEWHHLVWTSTTLAHQQELSYLVVTHGTWFWVNISFVYILLSSSTYWLLRAILATPEQFRGQIILLLAGSLCPWIGNALYITDSNPFPHLDLTPFAFAITAFCFTLALLRFKFLDVVPIAREMVVDKLENGVIVLDSQQRVLDINQTAANLLAKEKKEIIGKPLYFHHSGWSPLTIALQQNQATRLELSINQTFYEASIVLLDNINNRANGRLITLYNVTNRKKTELLLQQAKETAETANQAKTHFLTNMSHEIRTPLNAVVGMTEMLRQTNLNANQNEMVDVMAKSSNTLLQLINNILDFSRLEAANLTLKQQAFDLVDCVEAAIEAVHHAANEKLITLTYHIQDTTPTHLTGDPVRLRQILINLLENGVKFSEEGTVHIHIGHIQNQKAVLLEFAVEDEGIGIAPDQIDQLFLPFQQIDGSLTRNYGGSGLGLVICKRLVELMGGEIQIRSAVGQGTNVRFTVQMNLATENDPIAVTLRQDRASLASKRLLIIASDATQRRHISKEARMAGLDVYVAASDQEACYWIDNSLPFDVVLLDTAVWHQDPGILAHLQNKESQTPLPTILLGPSADELSQTLLAQPDLFAGTLTLPIQGPQLYDSLLNIISVKNPSKKRAPGKSMAAQHPLAILLVEDNKLNRRVLTNMLGKLGYQADIAKNGRIAVEMTQKQRYDIILMDIQMPEMDGIEATKQILANGNSHARPYISAVTAHALAGDRETYLAAGMNHYLSKPVTINKLVEALYQGIEFQNYPAEAMPVFTMPPQIAPSTPLVPSESPINLEELAQLVGEDTGEFLAMMAPIFLEDGTKLVQSLTHAVQNKDCLATRQAAHTLKGTSASMGMPKLSQFSRELETMAKEEALADAPQKLAEIQAEFARAEQALAAILQTAV